MRFTLYVDTDNDARILREVAKRVDRGDDISHCRTIFDVNGNDCGRFALKGGE